MATSTTEVETIGDYTQLVALVNPIFVTRPYVSYLAANGGLVTSLADLGSKINNGTVTNNDYIDVLKDLGAVGTSLAALAEAGGLLAAGTVLPWAIGIGVGLAALDYADAHNYDTTEMYEDIKSKIDMLKDYLNGDTPPEDSDLTYDPSKFDPNTSAPDTDHDGIPDSIDPDRDGDGIPNAEDSDQDGDGIPDSIDPDPLTPNPNPKDGHPFAPLPPLQRRDPLVLDMNKDGLISTVSLADSTAFFDLTGDGIKEKVGWVQASEGIVAFDKNGNGKIDGISEVFGTATTSGFAELRTLADSNYDGVIDRRDELYNQLKVWQDMNQDGISQASELKTLSQAGVNTIELNVFATNINLNGNLLTEAGRYGDTMGERELAADIQLMTLEKVNNQNFRNTRRVA